MVLAVPHLADVCDSRYFVRHDGSGWAVAVRDTDGRIYDALPGVRTPSKSQAEAFADGLLGAYIDGMLDGCQHSYRELRAENEELLKRLGRRY